MPSTVESLTCRQVWEEMNTLLSKEKFIRNYSRCIQMGQHRGTEACDDETTKGYNIETDLFPLEALKVYSAHNLGDNIKEVDQAKYFSAHRGGSQGDYREEMKRKVANVVDCLSKYPESKRAVITVPNTSLPSHTSDDDAKCMREIHFYLDGEILNATVWMRAQAAEIFPKNIHFVGTLMDCVATSLTNNDKTIKIGQLFYLATTIVSVRED